MSYQPNLATIELTPSTNALVVDWTSGIRRSGTLIQLITEMLIIAGGVAILSLLTLVRINIGIVPITGQTLGVLLVGAALGWDRGIACVITYLMLGLWGAPVFATIVGPAAFVGPTAGYLLSFIPAVAAVGWLADRGWDRNLSTAIWSFLIGHAIIFAVGVTWLAFWLQDLGHAISLGLLPFIPGMVIKTVLATGLLPFLWHLRHRRH